VDVSVQRFWRSFSGLAAGVVLLLILILGINRVPQEWAREWHHEESTARKSTIPTIDPTFAKDPSIASAQIKVIGPLASATKVIEKAVNDPAAKDAPIETDSATADIESEEQAKTESTAAVMNPDGLGRASTDEYAPLSLCHGKINLVTTRVYPFEVPAHVLSPRVTGHIASMADTRGVEVILLNQQQYAEYLQGQAGDAIFANELRTGDLDVALHSGSSQPQKFFLILNNLEKQPQKIGADFKVSFE